MQCPMCKKKLMGNEQECPYCRCDVSLLSDYVNNLQEGLREAEEFTRKGELGEAIWSYLSVLELDPDNPTARQQIGRVVTAVRQFDLMSPASRLARRLRFRHYMGLMGEVGDEQRWIPLRWMPYVWWGLAALLLAGLTGMVGFVLGYLVGIPIMN